MAPKRKDRTKSKNVAKSTNQKRKREENEEVDDDITEKEVVKESKRSRTKAEKKQNDESENKNAAKKKEKNEPKNKTSSTFDNIDFSCTKKNEKGQEWNVKVSSWNVDGIRAWLKKGGLEYVEYEKPDIFCIQETKCSLEKLPDEVKELDGYHAYWSSADKDGYSGVGLYSKMEPLDVKYGFGVAEHDSEGRLITAEYDKFYVISVYVPNAGRGLVTLPKRLRWNEEFRKFVKNLDSKKPVIICGDMNVAHSEIDLANPKTNKKNAGFTQEERDGMTEFLSDGYVDSFRQLYPDEEKVYTFWTYMSNARSKNVGWRLDYFIVSERLMPSICDNVIRNEVFGSDHCPVTLFLNF